MSVEEIHQGSFHACPEPYEHDNFSTSIYDNGDHGGLLIARCNQNGRYPEHVLAILNGLDGKRQSAEQIATLTATNAELREQVERLRDKKKELLERCRRLDARAETAEALLNTAAKTVPSEAAERAAVKVKPAVLEILDAIKSLDDLGIEDGRFVFDSRKELREILSTLSPAESEPEQEAAAWVKPSDLDNLRDPFSGGEAGFPGKNLPARKTAGGNFTLPLYTRPPSERAVTEADLKLAYLMGRAQFAPALVLEDSDRTERDWQKVRAALTTAMEAKR